MNTYTASIVTPDGLHIFVELSAPTGRGDVDELSELAQMAALQTKRLIERNQPNLTDKVPF